MTNRSIALNRGVAIATGLSLIFGSVNLSWADQVLRTLKTPLQVQLQTPVQGPTATVGQPFEATLAQPVHYKNWTLPQGTHFKGHITKVGPSKHFGRPGYVIMQTDEAALPSGQTITFDPAKYEPRNRALHHPDTETFWESAAIQLPYTMASLAVTIPLRTAADVDWLPLLVIGEGVRMVTGGVVGLFRPKFKNEPVPRKVALGVLDGSGIPRLVNFIGKYPEPDYKSGDTAELYLNPQGLSDLFQSNQASVAPLQPDLSQAVQQSASK